MTIQEWLRVKTDHVTLAIGFAQIFRTGCIICRFYSFRLNICAKPYVVIHEDTDQAVKAWFPDFADQTVPGDRLSDTLTIAPPMLQQHVEEMSQLGEWLPDPATPDLWDIYAKHPSALIGFVKISIAED